jgi:hypothetical protein
MFADRQRFHQRQLFHGQRLGRMEFPGWQQNRLGQPSIAHDSERFMMLAAIGQPTLARIASLAVEVGFDRAPVTDGMVRYAVPQG